MLDATQIFDGTFAGTPAVPTGVAITTTRVSTNVLDMLTGRDVGVDSALGIHCQVLVALTGGTSLQVDFEVCDTAGGTYLPLLFSPVIPAAQLIAGEAIFRVAVPVNQVLNATAGILKAPGRYLRLTYTVVGTFTAGTVFAYMSPAPDRQTYYSYPENYATH